ncbi:MAG: O-antigen ligase family protein [Vulcanimicrobiaceae bacterium]
MPAKLERGMPAALGFAQACVPFFPAFITLTTVTFPGISIVPPRLAWALLAAMALLAVYATIMVVAPPRRGSPIGLPMWSWVAASMLAAILGFNPHDGVLFIGIFALGAIWHCALVRYYAVPGAARAIAWAFMVSGGLAAAAAVVMVVTRIPAAQYTIGNGRAIGTFVLPGELAGYLIVLLPIAYAIARISRERALRAVAVAAIVLGAVAMALSFSRTGWIGLAAAVAFLTVMRAQRFRQGAMWGIVVVGAAVIAVLLAFNVHHNPSENYTRLSIWQAALQIIDRFPLTGVGPFGFSKLYAVVRLPDGDATAFHAHSVYLTFLAELGIVGFSAFVWTWWSFARSLRAALRLATPDAAFLAVAIAAGLIGTLVQGLIDVVSVVIFGLWLPTLAYALVAARHGLMERADEA